MYTMKIEENLIMNYVTIENSQTGKLECIPLFTSEPLTETKAKELILNSLGTYWLYNQINDNPFED